MVQTTLQWGIGGRGGIEEPDERDGGMVGVNRDKPIKNVDDVAFTGAVEDVEQSKVFDVGNITTKHWIVEDVRMQRAVEELNSNEMMVQQRGEDEEEMRCGECDTTGFDICRVTYVRKTSEKPCSYELWRPSDTKWEIFSSQIR